MDFNEARINSITNYLTSNSKRFSKDKLAEALLKAGYQQAEIDFAFQNAPQLQSQIQNQVKDSFYRSNADIIAPQNTVYHNEEMAEEAPIYTNFDSKSLLRKLIVPVLILTAVFSAWWTTNEFIFYKGLKNGRIDIEVELQSKAYGKDVIAKLSHFEVSKDKVKLYVSVKNNLTDKKYTMWGSVLGSFIIKDQKGEKFKDFRIDLQQEQGGELAKSSIQIEPGQEISGWISFENPDDRRIKSFKIEHALFATSEDIKL